MKVLSPRAALVASSLMSAIVLLFAQSAAAIPGDGTNFIYCNSRFTIATKYWNLARLSVYGCGNGYVYAYVVSGTNWAKGVGIVRNSPSASRYVNTTGYSLYSTVTPMLTYVRGTCYSATGWSMDSNYGAEHTFKWCH